MGSLFWMPKEGTQSNIQSAFPFTSLSASIQMIGLTRKQSTQTHIQQTATSALKRTPGIEPNFSAGK